MNSPFRLYRDQELAFRTQYAELKERTLAAGALLPGTPGTLAMRTGTGHPYWYRVYYPAPGRQAEEFVCKEGQAASLQTMRERMAHAEWVSAQVSALRKLGFQVADKLVARVLVELHNHRLFDAGLVLVGTLGFMAWLNELGAVAVGARTLDVDLARSQRLEVATPLGFANLLRGTNLPFVAVPGLPASRPSTALKLPGADGLRIDVLAPGKSLGAAVRVPELEWNARAIPFYDYLLDAPEPAAMLAGGHCIPIRLPQASRFVWHKLYASTQRRGFPEKAAKDRQQALTLGAVLARNDTGVLESAWHAAPSSMTDPIRRLLGSLRMQSSGHVELQESLERCLST